MKPPIIAELLAYAEGEPTLSIYERNLSKRAASMIESVWSAREDETFDCACGKGNCNRRGVHVEFIDAALSEHAKAATDAK